jgi:hypothetical protein
VVPNQQWRWHFSGVIQETNSQQQAASSRLPDARLPVTLDLIFDAVVHPVWSMKDTSGYDWGHFHTEQGGRFKGRISWGDETVELNCTGWRDHSVGPRNFGTLAGNVMAVCVFPSGKTLQASTRQFAQCPID